jgi:hypothetical protein
VQGEVQGRVEQYAATLGMAPGQLDVDLVGACGDRDTMSTVTVRTAYQFRVLSNLSAGLAPSLDLVASSVMRNEGSG